MKLLAVALSALTMQTMGLLCKSGQCDIRSVSCVEQPAQCEMTTRGMVVMDQPHAFAMCASVGMELVSPGDSRVNAEMQALCPTAAFFDLFVKLDTPCNRFVVNSTGEEQPFFNWDEGEPNNGDPFTTANCSVGKSIDEGCVGFSFDDTAGYKTKWNDRLCTSYGGTRVTQFGWTAVLCVLCAKLKPITTTTTTQKPTTIQSRITDQATPIANNSSLVDDLDRVSHAMSTHSTHTLIIVVSCLAVCMFLLCIAVVVLLVRRRKQQGADLAVVSTIEEVVKQREASQAQERSDAEGSVNGVEYVSVSPQLQPIVYSPIPPAGDVFDTLQTNYTVLPSQKPQDHYDVGPVSID
jgi:hypothetical protein